LGYGILKSRIMLHREVVKEESKEIRVPYTLLDSTDISKVAFAINVQLTLNDANEQHSNQNSLPFVFPNDFDNVKDRDNLFIYGPSGCGKSRTIVEIISKLSNAGRTEKIYVINPRNAIGVESGMISLYDLVNKLCEKDVVIWDNFPDGIIQRDIASAIRVLEIVSSRRTMKLLVALKPSYLESYGELVTSIMPDFSTYYVKYDRGKIRNILKSYGTSSSTQYRRLYENYITQEIDTTSQILWQKDPTPLTVLDYYKDLVSKEKEVLPSKVGEEISSIKRTNELNAVAIAEKLPSSKQYYAQQFELLNSSVNRQSDVQFLVALKLCYEIGLERSIDLVRKIHKGIFGDAIMFHEPTRLLDTWIYTSGQYYAMHDSCREAIRLTDTIRSKTVAYLCNNLVDLLSGDSNMENTKMKSAVERSEDKHRLVSDQLLHSLGLFLGRNVQFMPSGPSHPFLPDPVYLYIRQNLQLENAVGQGIGDSFESLDENLQKIIMNRIESEIELASGMAESLGHLYTMFDKNRRSQLMTKIYSGGLFARYFGQSLGRLFKYITPDLQEEIFGHMQSNPQFADGIGTGLGYIFRSLDTIFQREILQKAQTNGEMSRGLGFGFGLRFPLMDQKEMIETFSKADTDPEFDNGFGMGLASLFNKYRNHLPHDFFESQVVSWGKGHAEFMIGFGIMCVWLALDHLPKEVTSLMENEGGELAYGASLGYGMYLLYMMPEAQNFILSKADESIKFDLGLGSGLGIVFKHLSRNVKDGNLALARGDKRSEYDVGIGFGIGYMWQYQNQDVVSESFLRMVSNNGFAFGLGYGLGYTFEYLSVAARDQLFDKADKNLEFDIGLGFGIGWKFLYLSGELLFRVTSRIATRHGFAFGLGRGLGRIFRYLPMELRRELLGDNQYIGTMSPPPASSVPSNTSAISCSQSINRLYNFLQVVRTAKENPSFIRGFASGLGSYVFMTYDTDPGFVKRIFKYVEETAEFPIGLGEGLGYSFRYLPADFKDILENFQVPNLDFSRGMGIGLGRSIEYVSTEFADKIFDMASNNTQFATGLGIGVGTVFKYLPAEKRDYIESRIILYGSSGFARGLGHGLGSIYGYLSEEIRSNIVLKYLQTNSQFATGIGIGLGSIYGYLSEEIRSNIVLKYLQTNSQFATGLGLGVGKVFKVISQDLTREAWTMADLNSGFARGLGHGLGSLRPFLSADLVKIIFSKLQENIEFARGLGHGLGSVYQYLQEETRNQILNETARAHERFGKGLGFSLGHHFAQLPEKLREELLEYVTANQEFGYSLGEGIGRNFVSLDAELQEQILSGLQETQVFGLGVGRGLGETFNLLDPTLAQEILADAFSEDSIFAYALGEGIGRNFVSLRDKVQDEIILRLSNVNLDLSIIKGLKVGLQHSFEYLDKNVVEKLTDTKEDILHVDADFGTSKDILKIGQEDYHFNYDSFPVIGLNPEKTGDPLTSYNVNWDMTREEIAFLGQRQHACVCFIDMMNSTKITSVLDNVELARYYSVFLNSMASIAKNYGAKIIKNAGDCLIYYFPDTSDKSNLQSFRNVLDCSLTMISAHRVINAKLLEEKLPSLNYRISADYGEVEFARMQSSNTDDLFGAAMNKCAKINSKAPPNGIVIGEEFFKIIRPFEDKYSFITVDESVPGIDGKYLIFHVTNKDNRKTFNPFNKKSQTDRNKFF
jgi:class 3 adenylate cyclase